MNIIKFILTARMKKDKYIEIIKKIVLNKMAKYKDVKVIFFGSRAKGEKILRSSDVDIAIDGDFKKIDLINLKEELEEAPIPYEVDIVNLNTADEIFKQKVYKEGIFWKK